MGRFYIINAPWAFSTAWSVVKGWLDEATVAKIHILGSDYKDELLRQVPEDSLPAFLGGKCSCPQGCSMSDAGPWSGRETKRTRSLSVARSQSSQHAPQSSPQHSSHGPQQAAGAGEVAGAESEAAPAAERPPRMMTQNEPTEQRVFIGSSKVNGQM